MGGVATTAKRLGAAFPPLRRAIQMGGRFWAQAPAFRNLYSRDLAALERSFEIFPGEWSSAVPGFETGAATLFDDARIRWVESQLGSFQGMRILELGPLEGGQTWMMESRGASVLAIEANQRAFLRCLIVKNALNMKSQFLYGDFRPYLENAPSGSFDLVTAIGVLYHMMEPLKLLHDIARVAGSFAVWTHYYDRELLRAHQLHFDPNPHIHTVDGKSAEVYQQNYLSGVTRPGFCGGSAPSSFWMTRAGLLEYVESLGFKVTIGSEELQHRNGPCILFLAQRQ